jgi:hypothetical protein
VFDMQQWANVGRAVVVALALAACTAAQGGTMLITSADFPAEVGMRAIYDFVSEDGTKQGKFQQTILEAVTVSGGTVYRVASAIGTFRFPDMYFMKGRWGWSLQNVTAPDGPTEKIPLPLQAGKTYTHRHGKTTIEGKVEGVVSVTVPAGTFQALLCVEQHEKDGETWTQKSWIAPKMGKVKMLVRADQMYTLSLHGIQRASGKPSEPGAVVLSNFDTGAPLVSPLFPDGSWAALPQDGKAISACEIEPFNAAAGTPMCLRWTYVHSGHWAHVGIVPSGQWGKPTDLSKYRAISFQARALKAGPCTLQIAGAPWANGNATDRNIPLKLTSDWQRLAFDLRKTPAMQGADLTKVYAIRFAHFGAAHANVVWIDEIMLQAAGSF